MRTSTKKWSAVLAASFLVASTLTVLPVVVASGAAPNLVLTESAPATVLYGTPATVTLTAANQTTLPGVPMYNTSFEDILPVGVNYVVGSSSVSDGSTTSGLADPTVQVNQPSTGRTTLIWSNVADVQPSSHQALTFKLQAETDAGADLGPNPVLPNSSYTDAASVYANSNPRFVPQFDPTTGAPVTSSYTDTDTSSGTTKITPLAITKDEPSPEHELPRGVHDHQVTYTVTVINNDVHATDTVTVTDLLPAGLEFLGCGGTTSTDNTTDASGTNPGSTQEYPGSGPLNVGSALSSTVCPTPTSVNTVLNPTDPSGNPLTGVYTQVTWTVPDLAASGTDTIEYKAAVPLRENSMTWSGTEPSAASGAQAANLDNNQGPETHDGQSLTNVVGASGAYQGALGSGANPVSAVGSTAVEAIDLAVQKTVDNPVFSGGTYINFTLHYQTSEYRYTTVGVLTDNLPSGLCPIGPANYTTDAQASECAPHGGLAPSIPYSSVVEQADGSFVITWNLPTLPPNTDTSITFPALDRSFYQGSSGGGIGPTTPTLVGDSLNNTTQITGTVNGTCYDGSPSAPTPDPTCTGTSPTVIYSGESTPTTATNGSGAGQTAAQPVITKRVSQAVAPGGTLNCSTATYLTSSSVGYPPTYEAGDTICFQLEVDFPLGLYAHNSEVTDFMPPNTSYVAASAVPATGNTVTIASTTDAGTTPDSLTFALGDTVTGDTGLYVSPGQTFLVDMAVKATAPPAVGNNFDLTANLMKFTAQNTAGQGISLRSQVSYNLSQPVLSVAKAVTTVNGGTPGAHVEDGDVVGYTVTATNTGLLPATNTVLWDNLPSQITSCTAVTLISSGGTCALVGAQVQIQWTGITVPAAVAGGASGTTALTYSMTVPVNATADETLANQVGVVSYQGPPPNNGGSNVPPTYYPASNINPASPTANAPAANGAASVNLAGPTLTKGATPTVNPPTNATIGEPILYTLTTVIPAGTTVYSASLDDPLGTRLTYSATPAAASGSLQVGTGAPGALPGGFTLTTAGNVIHLVFPTPFSTALTTADTIVVTFYATVADVGANSAGGTITNTGTFAWNNSTGTTPQSTTASANTTVVEPHLALTKTDALSGGPYNPGDTVTYTVKASNTGTSAASDVVVTDTLAPQQTTPTCVTAPANWTCVTNTGVTPNTITWTLNTANTLAVGAPSAATFTYTAVLPNPAIGSTTFTNNVAATATSLDVTAYPGARTTYTATGQDVVHLQGASVAKVASPSSVTIGVDTTYTATVTIPAGTNLPAFTAIDTLPDGMTFDAYGANGSYTCTDTIGSCGVDIQTQSIGTPTEVSGTGKTALAWYIGNVVSDPGVRTITVNYTAYPAKTYHTGSPVTAPVTLNNLIGVYWNDTAAVTPPTIIPTPASYAHASPTVSAPLGIIEPTLTITKTVSTPNPVPGTPFTYTLTVHNFGSATAHDPVVSDTVPAALDRSATSIVTGPASPSQGTATYTPGTGVLAWDMTGTTLAPNASATITFQTQLGASGALTTGQVITNTAQVTHYYGVDAATATGTPARYVTYGPVSNSVPVTPLFPVLHLAKSTPGGSTATVGTPFTWGLSVTDTVASAASVAVSDTLPAFWTYTPTGSPGANATTITLANGTVVSGANADPDVTTNSTTHVETLTWPGVASGLTSLGGLTSIQSIAINYTATPQAGVTHTNSNSATVTGQDGSGASGNASGNYTATATASAVVPTADLQITKTVGSTVLEAGASNNVYNMVVKNNGPDTAASPIVVTDTAPTGTLFTAGGGGTSGWTCILGTAGATISCTLGTTLANGVTATTLPVSIDIPSSYTGSITNIATVSSPTNDPVPANNTSSVTATVTTGADLSIVKSHTGNFTAGSSGTYQLAVTNNGPSDSPGTITVVDTLPTGETYVSAVGTGWTCTNTSPSLTVTCTLAAGLISGAVSAITLTVNVPSDHAAGSLTNTATVSGPLSDPDTSNNTSSDATPIVTSAHLAIAKTHAVGTGFVPGNPITYSLAVSNSGPSDAVAPVVTDTLPAYETYVSASGTGWTCGDVLQVVTCTATANLASGASATPIAMVVTLASSFIGSSVVNSASVTSTNSPTATSTDTSNSGSALANISLVKTHADPFTAGSNGTYHFTVGNAGPSDAAGPLMVVDTLPTGESFVSGGGGTSGWTCTNNTPAAGQVTCQTLPGAGLAVSATNTTLAITVKVASNVVPGNLTNTAVVTSGTPDPTPGDNTATDPTTVITVDDLGIVKLHTSAVPFVSGTPASYSLDVTNAGPSDAASPVTITDPLPAGETFVSGTGTGWSCAASGQVVTCTLAAGLVAGTTLAPNHAALVTLNVGIDANYVGSTLSNTATVTSPTTDSGLTNNTSTASVTATQQADLTVSKTHPGTAVAGSNLVYQLTVTNHGPSDSAGTITITDPLPIAETFVSATGTGWVCTATGQNVTCSLALGLVTGGTSAPITMTVGIDPADVAATVINTATVHPGATTDPDLTNNTSTDTAPLTTSADLSIVKTHSGTFTPGGANATYSLAVANAGPSDAAGPVTVTDPLPTGETYVSATGTGWTCSATGQQVTCTLAAGLPAGTTLVPNAASPITLTVAVDGAAYPSVSNTATVASPTADPVSGNNTSTDVAPVEVASNLTIVKTHTGTPVAGENLTYSLAIANTGLTADPGPVTVTDPLPTGETFVSATGTDWTCGASGQNVTCTLTGPVAVGWTSTISLVVSLGAVPSVSNTASVTGDPSDPHVTHSSSTDTTLVDPGATLSVTKGLNGTSLVTGGQAAYTVTVTDHGPSAATGVTLTDTVPAGLQPTSATGTGWTCTVSGQIVKCTYAPALAAGSSTSVIVNALVTATTGAVANAVTVATLTTLITQTGTSASTSPTGVTAAAVTPSPTVKPVTPPAAAIGLAFTGFDVLLLVMVGLCLIAFGLLLVWRIRRQPDHGRGS
jgi:uncharacterized repeat protein (TIGR01451 family)/fimbrial isopeptide formation D2 family protein